MTLHESELTLFFEHSTEAYHLELLTDKEQMKLFLRLKKVTELSILEPPIIEAIYSKIPQDLIDLSIVKEAIKVTNTSPKEQPPSARRIAKGRVAEPGSDGKLLLLAKALDYKQQESAEKITGLYELHLFDNIEPDRIIGRIYPPKNGIDGITATGKVIPSVQGKPVAVKIDATIRSENGDGFQVLKSNKLGYLEKQGDSLSVKEELMIKGDIDFRTGNIDFINKVKVTGDVGSGFRVRGANGVSIAGGIQSGCTIIGGDGDIEVSGYIVGSKLEAKGNITVSNIQETEVEAGGWVIIHKQSIDSTIRACQGIFAEKAHLFGGSLYCVEGCTIGILGNTVGHPTTVAITTKSAVTSFFSSLQKKLTIHEDALTLLKAHLGPFAQNPARIERLLEPHKTKVKELYKKYDSIMKSLTLMTEEIKEYQKETIKPDASITFNKKAHQGVTIEYQEEVMWLLEPVTGPKTIMLIDGKLQLLPAQPIKLPDFKGKKGDKK